MTDYGGLARERKELRARPRQTDRQTRSRKPLPARVWGCTAHQAGAELFMSSDLLSTAVGCLPRGMR